MRIETRLREGTMQWKSGLCREISSLVCMVGWTVSSCQVTDPTRKGRGPDHNIFPSALEFHFYCDAHQPHVERARPAQQMYRTNGYTSGRVIYIYIYINIVLCELFVILFYIPMRNGSSFVIVPMSIVFLSRRRKQSRFKESSFFLAIIK
jgi:hypothetical protein